MASLWSDVNLALLRTNTSSYFILFWFSFHFILFNFLTPFQDYTYSDDQTLLWCDSSGFKPFTVRLRSYEVKPPCAATSHRWPPPISNLFSKTLKCFQSNLYSWNLSQVSTSHKRPWPLFELPVWISLLFITSSKRSLDTWSHLTKYKLCRVVLYILVTPGLC